MRKIFVIILIFAGFSSFGQSWKQYYDVPDKNSQFGVAIPYGQVVFQRDSSAWYKITRLMLKNDSMATVFRLGSYVKINVSNGIFGVNSYEIKIDSDDENDWNLPFVLKLSTVVMYNGSALHTDEWSGIGTAILNITINVKRFDQVLIIN